ncbi:MAG: cytochrome c biogenesis protein ResB [Chloroflexi bacterium]|nr:cytochrome c biogenesis protein ResB [Chloroflexota bacterium]
MTGASIAQRSARFSDPLAEIGLAAWRLLTSVRFAVIQIIVIAVAGVFGTLLPQMPASAVQDPSQYAQQIQMIQSQYAGLAVLGIPIGPALVDVFDRLGLLHVFSVWWFTTLLALLAVSIVVCTLDRTPRLWRQAREVHVTQPAGFFDLRLANRAQVQAPLEPDVVAAVLRRHRFVVRRAEGIVYGDRNQYFRLATLLTHAGLVTFLLAAAITGAFGYQTVLVLGDGQTAPVQPVGTPGNLIIKNVQFEAPVRANGTFADFWTNVVVYRDGRAIAQKTIHVNDPLTVDGWVVHQNTFGPAANLEIHDAHGRLLWTGPVLLAGTLAGLPQGFLTIPGSSTGLLVVLDRTQAGAPRLTLQGLKAGSDGTTQEAFIQSLSEGQTSAASTTGGYSIQWTGVGAFSGLVVRRDPGQMLVWIAFTLMTAGLVLTFYFPRRRVWVRLRPDRAQVTMLADRYVDVPRELGTVVRHLGAAADLGAAGRA